MSLQAHKVSVHYGERAVLQDIDLDLRKGELAALIGPNGSGKSSLLKALAGLLPHGGRVTLAGEPRPVQRVGYMPQDTSATAALTVLETVLLGRVGRLRWQVADEDLAAVEQVLTRLGIAELGGRWLGELSGGQRQMVFLAQALVAEPLVLLLDEPISALDLRHQLEVMETVRELTRERSLVSLVVLHDLNAAARHADHVMLLRQGTVVAQGEPSGVLHRESLLHVFQVETERLLSSSGRTVLVPLRSVG